MKTPSLTQRLFNAIFPKRTHLTVSETENTILIGSRSIDDSDRDRLPYDRVDTLNNCLDAWRYNPLARRIIELTSQYVVGGGFTFNTNDKENQKFLENFWNNRLNKMEARIIEMCDELSRSGNLFILLSTDPSGMSYIREIPANSIEEIISSENDFEQPILYKMVDTTEFSNLTYKPYDPLTDVVSEDGTFSHVVLHYTINKPAGAQWGESDLAPILKWLSRYSSWLEDRVRLNRYRNAFLYVVKANYVNEATRKARQLDLAANPPVPGSILVTDESETWDVITPKLEAMDAQNDGLAIKKMIASGAGVPLHFLAEPESSTRSTAEASGGPTYRKYDQRQQYFAWLLHDLLKVVLSRRALVDATINPEEILEISAADITARDNISLSMSGSNVGNLFERLFDMGFISREEMIRVIYKFIGEEGDPIELLKYGTGKDIRYQKYNQDPSAPTTTKPLNPVKVNSVSVDPESGDLKSVK